jgi:hypothetical protein
MVIDMKIYSEVKVRVLQGSGTFSKTITTKDPKEVWREVKKGRRAVGGEFITILMVERENNDGSYSRFRHCVNKDRDAMLWLCRTMG